MEIRISPPVLANEIIMPTTRQRRTGATLVEVLMSLLIFGVGVVSVFTLFPLSIVSSIRATQLTHGKIVRDNVQEILHVVPEVLRPPFGAPWNPDDNWRGNWVPLRSYGIGDVIFPTIRPGKVFPNPYFALRCTADGTSSTVEPDWNASTFEYTEVGGPTWQVVRIPNYVVDPYGYYRSGVPIPAIFGDHEDLASNTTMLQMLPRRTPGPGNVVTNETLLTRFFSSPDTWSVVFEEIPVNIANDTSANQAVISFSNSIDLSTISNDATFPYMRVVLTNPDQTKSVVRYPFPNGAGNRNEMLVNQVVPNDTEMTGPARLESFTNQYSYFLTVSTLVNNQNLNDPVVLKESFVTPKISVVVMFNRRASADSEYAYFANFGGGGAYTDTSIPNLADSTLAPDQIRIVWGAGDPDPFLKVGSYILDARKMVFYRISAVSSPPYSGYATVTVNDAIEPAARTRTDMGAGLAVLMPGIVHVYNIDGLE